jgi:hypothetical protein
MGLAKFTIDLTADKPPALTVNGRELPVVALTLRHVPPSLPQLVLELAGEGLVAGEGIVALDAAGDTAADVRSFLAGLDPDKLDEIAARMFGEEDDKGRVIAGPGQAFIAAILDQLPAS